MAKLAPDYRTFNPGSTVAAPRSSVDGLKRRRSYTKVACNNCRLRKWACDGDRPQCASCRKNAVECVYSSIDKSETHIGIIKRENEALRRRAEDLSDLLDRLKNLPPDLAEMALLKLRYDDSASVLRFLRAFSPQNYLSEQATAREWLPDIQSDLEFQLMAQYPVAYSLPQRQVSTPLTRPNTYASASFVPTPTSEQRHNRPTHAKRVDPTHASPVPHPPPPQPQPAAAPPPSIDPRLQGLDIAFWTGVPASNDLVAGALSLYLKLEHPFQGLFDADLFLDSLVSRSSRYCSPLLVNALLGYACQGYTTQDSRSPAKGYEFEREADKIFADKPSDSIPNLSGTFLLWVSHICHGSGQDGLAYVDVGVQMAGRMKFYGVPDRLTADDVDSATHCSAAAHAAWGCFTMSMIQTLYAKPVATHYPPLLPIPGCVKTRASSPGGGGGGDHDVKIDFSGVGDTFQTWCKFWRLACTVLVKYRSESKPTLEFTLAGYYKLVALSREFPPTMKCVRGASTPVMTFHVFFHALILDIFRPFLANRNQRSFRSLPANAPSPQAIFAASVRQLKQIILIFSNHPEAASSIFWHIALMYVAAAVVKDRTDPEWRAYFFLCLHHYKTLSRSFGIVQWLVPGILSIAVQYGALGKSEASSIKQRFREGQEMHATKSSGAGFVVDMDLAVTDWRAAQADKMAAELEELSLFDEFTAGIV